MGRQAADLDYRITVLADACADSGPAVHRALLEKVFPRRALVTTTDEWTAALLGITGTRQSSPKETVLASDAAGYDTGGAAAPPD